MKYALLIYVDDTVREGWSDEEQGRMMGAHMRYTRELSDAGKLLAVEALQLASTATTVHVREAGDAMTTDGPFAETKEQLAGFYLIDAADLDEAIVWAKKMPQAGGSKSATGFGREGFDRPVLSLSEGGSTRTETRISVRFGPARSLS